MRKKYFSGFQRFARADDDTCVLRIEMNDIERVASGDPNAAALANSVMDDAFMAAKHAAIDVDDIAGIGGSRLELRNDVRIFALGHEADVLAVLLVGDGEAQVLRQWRGFPLGHAAERKAQIVDLLLRGGKKKIALVLVGIDRTKRARCTPLAWLRM